MRKILLLILTCLIAGISFSQTAVQPSNLWTDKFTNDENYAASYCIASDDLNHVYNAIASEGTLLRAFDTEGEVLYSVNIEGISFPSDIIADSDNNWLYINGNPDHSLCKIDKSSGDVIWVEKLNTNSSSWGSTYAMTLDTEGNIIIVGTESGLGYRVIKFDSDANTLFDETFTVEGFSIPRGVTCDADNNIILTGEYDGSKTALLKVSSEGVLVWEVLDPSKPGANGVLVDQNNDIVITGSSLSSGIQFIHKYDADGNNVWKKTGYEDYTGFGIIEDAQGNYIVAGDHTTNAATWQGEQAITCYSSDGEILWNHTEQVEYSQTSMAISKMKNGNIALSGTMNNAAYHQWAYTSVYEITETQYFKVTFIVTDNVNSEFIENAEITFNDKIKTTDNEGTAVFTEVLPNTYDFSVSVSDYLIEEGSVTIIDEDIVINVSISPINSVDIQSQVLKIYPNPTSGLVNIEISNYKTDNTEYYITDVSGAIVKRGAINSINTSINLSHFSKGYYFLVLKTENGKLTSKIVLID